MHVWCMFYGLSGIRLGEMWRCMQIRQLSLSFCIYIILQMFCIPHWSRRQLCDQVISKGFMATAATDWSSHFFPLIQGAGHPGKSPQGTSSGKKHNRISGPLFMFIYIDFWQTHLLKFLHVFTILSSSRDIHDLHHLNMH